jgi:hypothetical protein
MFYSSFENQFDIYSLFCPLLENIQSCIQDKREKFSQTATYTNTSVASYWDPLYFLLYVLGQ